MEKLLNVFGEKRQNNLASLSPYQTKHSTLLEPIFYNEVLDHMELVLDENQEKLAAYTNYLQESGTTENKITFSCFDINNSLVGITQIKHIDTFNKKCEMGGTWYGKKYQGSGINFACKHIVFQFLFEVIGFRRVQFSIDIDNIASIKSMKKIGATEEGCFRKNWVDSEGISRNDLYFSITDDDWYKIKTTIYKDFYL